MQTAMQKLRPELQELRQELLKKSQQNSRTSKTAGTYKPIQYEPAVDLNAPFMESRPSRWGTHYSESAWLDSVGILKRYQGITFESIEKRGIPQAIKEKYGVIKQYAERLAENIKTGQGLILVGSVGTMKTTVAVAILRKWLEDENHSGYMTRMCTIIDNIFTMQKLSHEDWMRFEDRLRNTPLLIIDDLGTENTGSDWVLGKVESIIMDRYDRMKPVIITTNMSQEEMANTYSGRLLDRLRSTCYLVTFGGKSNRQTQTSLQLGE